jgi:cyclophilin family peptidyl-prolyl cis-trans isomerase
MLSRVSLLALILFASATAAPAQVVRFETTVGEFDMVLNPRNEARLQGHVNNLLQYVNNNSYNGSWINRADISASGTPFVLQMGGFFSQTKRPPLTLNGTRSVDSFTPVLGEPASSFTGLSNTVGTVAMALPGLPTGGTNQDGGSNSFFVNLTTNDFLDADFTVFAAIPDMTVVNQIMDLTKVDRTTDPNFGAGGGNLAFTDIPVTAEGFQVFIKRAFVVTDTIAVAQAVAGVQSALALSESAAAAALSSASSAAIAVPEPSALAVALAALAFIGRRRSRGP